MPACDFTGIQSRAATSGAFRADKESRQAGILQALCELVNGFTNGTFGADLSSLQPEGAEERLTVDNTVGGVQLSAFGADVTHVAWSAQDATMMVTFSGDAPTSTNGYQLDPGDSGIWSVEIASAAKFIRQGSTNGVIHAGGMKPL